MHCAQYRLSEGDLRSPSIPCAEVASLSKLSDNVLAGEKGIEPLYRSFGDLAISSYLYSPSIWWTLLGMIQRPSSYELDALTN